MATRNYIAALLITLTPQIAAQDNPSIDDIREEIQKAYDNTESINLQVNLFVVDTFDFDPDIASLQSHVHFVTRQNSFYFERTLYRDGGMREHTIAVWDGTTSKSINTYNILSVGGPLAPNGHVANTPDQMLNLISYPVPWNVVSSASRTFYWFNAKQNTIHQETITIDGHACYVITSRNPVMHSMTLQDKQFRSYLDPAIGFMPRRVDELAPNYPDGIMRTRRYKDYRQSDGGLWYASRFEVERFRTQTHLPTIKNVFIIESFQTDEKIEDAQFQLNFPPNLRVYDDTKIFTERRLQSIRTSPLTRPLILSVLVVVAAILISFYRNIKRKGA